VPSHLPLHRHACCCCLLTAPHLKPPCKRCWGSNDAAKERDWLSETLACGRRQRRLVKDTSNWSNRKENLEAERAAAEQIRGSLAELEQEGLDAKVAAAARALEEAEAECTRCIHANCQACARMRILGFGGTSNTLHVDVKTWARRDGDYRASLGRGDVVTTLRADANPLPIPPC
jgi:hypothetical protein